MNFKGGTNLAEWYYLDCDHEEMQRERYSYLELTSRSKTLMHSCAKLTYTAGCEMPIDDKDFYIMQGHMQYQDEKLVELKDDVAKMQEKLRSEERRVGKEC